MLNKNIKIAHMHLILAYLPTIFFTPGHSIIAYTTHHSYLHNSLNNRPHLPSSLSQSEEENNITSVQTPTRGQHTHKDFISYLSSFHSRMPPTTHTPIDLHIYTACILTILLHTTLQHPPSHNFSSLHTCLAPVLCDHEREREMNKEKE